MNTPLHRVEALLKASDIGLTVHSITKEAQVTEKEAKDSIKALHSMGQIEMIPTPGRWGPRYAWLAAKPVAVEPPAIPEEDLAAGIRAGSAKAGNDAAQPAWPDKSWASPVIPVPEYHAPAHEPAAREKASAPAQMQNPTRYVVAVPRRKLRVVRSAERAQAAALAAVRRGAAHAQVYELVPVGSAQRGVEWRADT